MRAMTLLFWAGIIVLLRVDPGRCEPRVIRDVAEATYRSGEDESPREAKQKAKDLALRRFVERVVGTHVRIEALAENTHVVYSMVDVWAVANVRIDSVVHNRYADYTADYRAHVSVARTKVDELLKVFDEITAVAVASKKSEIAERTRRRYAITASVPDMVVVPGYKDDPPFHIMRYPVSVWEYTKNHPRYESDFRFNEPATHVSWEDARGYCRSKGMRLPTAIEWERAYTVARSSGIMYLGNVVGIIDSGTVIIDDYYLPKFGAGLEYRREWVGGSRALAKTLNDPWSVRELRANFNLGFRCAQDAVFGP